ncbi:MAG: tetratricopeptide repeat protein [Chlorobiaceae bacterium]
MGTGGINKGGSCTYKFLEFFFSLIHVYLAVTKKERMVLHMKIFFICALCSTLIFGTAKAVPTSQEIQALQLSAEKGNADAQVKLGAMYFLGEGVRQDYAEALKWCRLSANQGNADAQLKVGWMYSNGYGVKQDYAEAVKWYRLSAQQGNANAQYNLGVMYSNGEGVKQDKKIAKEWFGKSCDNGLQQACDEYRKLQEQGY